AHRMGLTDPVFGMSPREVVAELFRGARGPVAALDPDEVRAGQPIRLAPDGGQEFRTPSGRLAFYSEQLAAQGLPPLPDWQPDPHTDLGDGATDPTTFLDLAPW